MGAAPKRSPAPHLVHLAANVREARCSAGVTQVALAARSGVELGHLNRIERGRTDPSTHTLLRLARGLGVPVAVFLADLD